MSRVVAYQMWLSQLLATTSSEDSTQFTINYNGQEANPGEL